MPDINTDAPVLSASVSTDEPSVAINLDQLRYLVFEGKKGYSPTVTVTDIEGGHRVTITDEDGDHTFDVMDGEGGGSDPFEIPLTQSGSTWSTTASAADIVANADNCIAVTAYFRYTPIAVIPSENGVEIIFSAASIFAGKPEVTVFIVAAENDSVTISNGSATADRLPAVSASDNGKVLGVVNGAWAKKEDSGSEDFVLLRMDLNGYVYNGTTAITGTQINTLAASQKAVFLWDEDNARLYAYSEPDPVTGDALFVLPAYNGNGCEVVIVNAADNGSTWYERRVVSLPPVTASDNGKVLKVVNGVWTAVAE